MLMPNPDLNGSAGLRPHYNAVTRTDIDIFIRCAGPGAYKGRMRSHYAHLTYPCGPINQKKYKCRMSRACTYYSKVYHVAMHTVWSKQHVTRRHPTLDHVRRTYDTEREVSYSSLPMSWIRITLDYRYRNIGGNLDSDSSRRGQA